MSAVDQKPHTDAIVSALEDAGLRVGEGIEPDGVGWQEWANGAEVTRDWMSYVIVQPLMGGQRDQGPEAMLHPGEDATLLYQVTCVAPTQPQCEEILDRVSHRMLREHLEVDGYNVRQVRQDSGSSQVRRDDDLEPGEVALFYATPRFRIWTVVDDGS